MPFCYIICIMLNRALPYRNNPMQFSAIGASHSLQMLSRPGANQTERRRLHAFRLRLQMD